MTKLPRLVMIEWLDARLVRPQWTLLEDVPAPKPMKAKSVGWLVRDGDVKVIVQTVGDVDDHPQGTGMVHIPACMVTAVHELGLSLIGAGKAMQAGAGVSYQSAAARARSYVDNPGTKMEMTDD